MSKTEIINEEPNIPETVPQSEEAIKRLQVLMSENQKLQAMVDQGGQVLNKQAYNNALWAKQNAQEAFKKAYEEGNADEMTKAQELLSKATLAEQQASNGCTGST